MITRPTVLLLGAGASAPYGFPTATRVRDLVCGRADPPPQPGVGSRLIAAGWEPAEVASFVDELRNSGARSVDAFLEHRTDLVAIGKAAIAAALIPSERPPALFDELDTGGRWYSYLLDQLMADEHDFSCNRLSIVTFNYDRSFDYFLCRALQARLGISFDRAAALATSIPIIHVHGSLGSLGPEVPRRPYEASAEKASIETAAAAIHIVRRHESNDEAFDAARKLLMAAQRILILGFGYSIHNLEKFGYKCFETAKLYGTFFGMREGEIHDAREWFRNRLPYRSAEVNILDLLRGIPALSR